MMRDRVEVTFQIGIGHGCQTSLQHRFQRIMRRVLWTESKGDR